MSSTNLCFISINIHLLLIKWDRMPCRINLFHLKKIMKEIHFFSGDICPYVWPEHVFCLEYYVIEKFNWRNDKGISFLYLYTLIFYLVWIFCSLTPTSSCHFPRCPHSTHIFIIRCIHFFFFFVWTVLP